MGYEWNILFSPNWTWEMIFGIMIGLAIRLSVLVCLPLISLGLLAYSLINQIQRPKKDNVEAEVHQ